MSKIFNLFVVVFFITSVIAVASDKDAIIGAEKGAWQSIKEKKYDVFQKMLSKDFHGVYASGINTMDKEMAGVKTVEFKSVDLGEMEVIFLNKDVAMVSYQVTIQGTEGSKDISGKMNAASIWRKDGNDWHIVFHTDMKAE